VDGLLELPQLHSSRSQLLLSLNNSSSISLLVILLFVSSVSLHSICATSNVIYVQVMMTDPVIAADGHSYEKAAMENWLQDHAMSPVTKQALDHPWVTPNINLRKVIAAVCQHAMCKQ
jgi:hypothetical protein